MLYKFLWFDNTSGIRRIVQGLHCNIKTHSFKESHWQLDNSPRRTSPSIDKDQPFLAASPTGLIGIDILIEVKCPASMKDMSPMEGIER